MSPAGDETTTIPYEVETMRYGITVTRNGEHVITSSVRTISSAAQGDVLHELCRDAFGTIEGCKVQRWVSDSADATFGGGKRDIVVTFVEYEAAAAAAQGEPSEVIEAIEAEVFASENYPGDDEA